MNKYEWEVIIQALVFSLGYTIDAKQKRILQGVIKKAREKLEWAKLEKPT